MNRKKRSRPRVHYMIADFTPHEKQRILKHCQKQDTSISSFLARVALKEAHRGSKAKSDEEEITIRLRIPREQSAKLKVFAQRQNKTPDQFCQDALLPTLEKERMSFALRTESLRYYLSPHQHKLLKKYLKAKSLSARTYIAFLAMQELNHLEKS